MVTTVPDAIKPKALELGFTVLRKEPGKPEEVVCMATDTGVLVPRMSNARGGRLLFNETLLCTMWDFVWDKREATSLRNLWVRHRATGHEAHVRWAAEGWGNGLGFLAAKVWVPTRSPVDPATMDAYPYSENAGLAYPSSWGGVKDGYCLSPPQVVELRVEAGPEKGRNYMAMVGNGSFDYPSVKDLGAPLIDSEGRFAGTLSGVEHFHEYRNQGFYTPAEIVLGYARLAAAEWNQRPSIMPRIYEWSYHDARQGEELEV